MNRQRAREKASGKREDKMKTRKPDPFWTCLEMIQRTFGVKESEQEQEVETHLTIRRSWKKCLLGGWRNGAASSDITTSVSGVPVIWRGVCEKVAKLLSGHLRHLTTTNSRKRRSLESPLSWHMLHLS